jgi:hypothetical protein
VVFDIDLCMLERVFLKIEKTISTEFVKEPYPSNLVNGTQFGCQKWLVEGFG